LDLIRVFGLGNKQPMVLGGLIISRVFSPT